MDAGTISALTGFVVAIGPATAVIRVWVFNRPPFGRRWPGEDKRSS